MAGVVGCLSFVLSIVICCILKVSSSKTATTHSVNVIGNGAKTTVLTTTDQQKNGNLPTLRKIKRGVLPPHKPTQNTTFNFAPTHPSPPTTLT
jgi:hypothetical protein